MASEPGDRQLEQHIRRCAKDTSSIIFTAHSRVRMRQRRINDPMVLDVLRMGCLALPPEPDPRRQGLVCRMQRYVAGVEVAVVVYVEYPASDLVIVTVMDVRRS